MALDIRQIMDTSPVMPVLVIHQLEDAVPLATALFEGGLTVLEITLRTPVALEAISAIKAALPDAIVGAGTVVDAQSLKDAEQAGAQFFVSPGVCDSLLAAAKASEIPLLPGVASPSEAMRLSEMGYTALKFFPAQAAGGTSMLKSIAGPLPHLAFCPTGGINPDNASSYLALANVRCIGGSWMASDAFIKAKDWPQIKALAQQAAGL